MRTFELNVDFSHAELTGTETLFGGIWVSLDGETFPQHGWPDFMTQLAGGLSDDISNIISDGEGVINFYFMDGPFEFRVQVNQLNWILEPTEDLNEEGCPIDPIIFIGSVLASVEAIQSYCIENNIAERDMNRLGSTIERLRESFSSYRSQFSQVS